MPIIYPTKVEMPCRDPRERGTNWNEVALGYTVEQAVVEARRCLQCQDPLCEVGCPVNVPIREFIHLVALRRFDEAAQAIRRRNLLPAICGRVCPVEHQCEMQCVVNGRQEPVGIGRLERFVADWERAHRAERTGAEAARRGAGETSGEGASGAAAGDRATGDRVASTTVAGGGPLMGKVAIVGSGPAGLTAASDLALRGYQVSVFEALHAFGGVLRYGIPEYRLPKAIINEDVENLRNMGVEFARNVVIGKTLTIDQLFDDFGFDAIFVGTGAGTPIFLGVPGENLKGVYSANEFLTRVNLMHANSFPDYDTPVRHPKRAVVVGAGDTAMDAVRTSIRLGADEAHIVYRRSEQEKGARDEDYRRAIDEGAIFDWLTLPKRFVGDEHGWVKAVECVRTELGEPDDSGRRRPVVVAGSEFTMEADLAVIALGTRPNPLVPQATSGLDTDSHGCIIADPDTGATHRKAVFAGGDITTGGATVILAMGAGRRAATAIDEYLQSAAGAGVTAG